MEKKNSKATNFLFQLACDRLECAKQEWRHRWARRGGEGGQWRVPPAANSNAAICHQTSPAAAVVVQQFENGTNATMLITHIRLQPLNFRPWRAGEGVGGDSVEAHFQLKERQRIDDGEFV